jgi:beta-glucosidase
MDADIRMQVSVKNIGGMDGVETVQVYVGFEAEDAPNPQLKKVVKLPLRAGEEKEISIKLPREAFMLYNEKGEKVLNPGLYHLYLGGQQPDTRSSRLTGKTVEHMIITKLE